MMISPDVHTDDSAKALKNSSVMWHIFVKTTLDKSLMYVVVEPSRLTLLH